MRMQDHAASNIEINNPIYRPSRDDAEADVDDAFMFDAEAVSFFRLKLRIWYQFFDLYNDYYDQNHYNS